MNLLYALAFLLAINAATILAFAIDKSRAVAGSWRIREATLLQLAALGGWPGALSARHRFRHKTRKQPFATYLQLIAMIEIGVAGGLAVALLL